MLFLFFKSDDFKGTYALLSKSVDKNPAKYERGVNPGWKKMIILDLIKFPAIKSITRKAESSDP